MPSHSATKTVTRLVPRAITKTVLQYATYFPAIGITGPRQSGKSTLARTCFPHLPYISFENPQVVVNTREDFAGFLNKYKNGAIFDEIQHIPELLSYLQEVIDEQRTWMGRFIITGSQNFSLNAHISQSLAGRIGMLTLLPLSLAELKNTDSYDHALFTGGYPGLHQTAIPPHIFFESYIKTYLERDVRQLKNISDLSEFQKFIRLCAARVGFPVNFTKLGADAGVTHTTAKQWLSILEASYLIYTLPTYHENFGKRHMKTPKLYFYDTGLAAYLLNISNEQQLETHYLRGNIFENMAVNELIKSRLNRGVSHLAYFWRKASNNNEQKEKEVDVIGEWDGHLYAIEIKYNASVKSEHIQNLHLFRDLYKHPLKQYVIYSGTKSDTLQDVTFVPLNAVETIFD